MGIEDFKTIIEEQENQEVIHEESSDDSVGAQDETLKTPTHEVPNVIEAGITNKLYKDTSRIQTESNTPITEDILDVVNAVIENMKTHIKSLPTTDEGYQLEGATEYMSNIEQQLTEFQILIEQFQSQQDIFEFKISQYTSQIDSLSLKVQDIYSQKIVQLNNELGVERSDIDGTWGAYKVWFDQLGAFFDSCLHLLSQYETAYIESGGSIESINNDVPSFVYTQTEILGSGAISSQDSFNFVSDRIDHDVEGDFFKDIFSKDTALFIRSSESVVVYACEQIKLNNKQEFERSLYILSEMTSLISNNQDLTPGQNQMQVAVNEGVEKIFLAVKSSDVEQSFMHTFEHFFSNDIINKTYSSKNNAISIVDLDNQNSIDVNTLIQNFALVAEYMQNISDLSDGVEDGNIKNILSSIQDQQSRCKELLQEWEKTFEQYQNILSQWEESIKRPQSIIKKVDDILWFHQKCVDTFEIQFMCIADNFQKLQSYVLEYPDNANTERITSLQSTLTQILQLPFLSLDRKKEFITKNLKQSKQQAMYVPYIVSDKETFEAFVSLFNERYQALKDTILQYNQRHTQLNAQVEEIDQGDRGQYDKEIEILKEEQEYKKQMDAYFEALEYVKQNSSAEGKKEKTGLEKLQSAIKITSVDLEMIQKEVERFELNIPVVSDEDRKAFEKGQFEVAKSHTGKFKIGSDADESENVFYKKYEHIYEAGRQEVLLKGYKKVITVLQSNIDETAPSIHQGQVFEVLDTFKSNLDQQKKIMSLLEEAKGIVKAVPDAEAQKYDETRARTSEDDYKKWLSEEVMPYMQLVDQIQEIQASICTSQKVIGEDVLLFLNIIDYAIHRDDYSSLYESENMSWIIQFLAQYFGDEDLENSKQIITTGIEQILTVTVQKIDLRSDTSMFQEYIIPFIQGINTNGNYDQMIVNIVEAGVSNNTAYDILIALLKEVRVTQYLLTAIKSFDSQNPLHDIIISVIADQSIENDVMLTTIMKNKKIYSDELKKALIQKIKCPYLLGKVLEGMSTYVMHDETLSAIAESGLTRAIGERRDVLYFIETYAPSVTAGVNDLAAAKNRYKSTIPQVVGYSEFYNLVAKLTDNPDDVLLLLSSIKPDRLIIFVENLINGGVASSLSEKKIQKYLGQLESSLTQLQSSHDDKISDGISIRVILDKVRSIQSFLDEQELMTHDKIAKNVWQMLDCVSGEEFIKHALSKFVHMYLKDYVGTHAADRQSVFQSYASAFIEHLQQMIWSDKIYEYFKDSSELIEEFDEEFDEDYDAGLSSLVVSKKSVYDQLLQLNDGVESFIEENMQSESQNLISTLEDSSVPASQKKKSLEIFIAYFPEHLQESVRIHYLPYFNELTIVSDVFTKMEEVFKNLKAQFEGS
jgi:hypothetical protein